MNIDIDSKKGGDSIWSNDFTLLLFSNFFLFFGAEMLSPVLPVYLIQNGGNNTQVGIVMGSFTISAIIIRLLATKATEYLGTRAFLIAGLAVCALAACGYYMVSAVLFIFLLRVFHGFGFGAATTLYGAIVSNMVPRSRIGEAMGFFGMGITIAVAIGPFIGATVVMNPNYRWVFLVSFGLILLAISLTQISSVGPKVEEKHKESGKRFAISDFLELRAILPSILALFFGISMAGMFTFIVLFGKEVGLDSIGIFFLIISFAEFVIRPLSGKLYDIKGHFPVLVPGAFACGTGTVLLSITTDLVMLILSSVFYGIGVGMLFPVLEAWALKSVKSDRRVAANATFYNFLDIGIGLGSVVLGILAQATSYGVMYLCSSLVFVLFLIVYITSSLSKRNGPDINTGL